MKYIKADDLIQFCTSMLVEAKDDLIIQTHNNCFRHMREHIKSLSSADVRENIHGKWLKTYEYGNDDPVQCSVCLMEFDYIDGIGYLTDKELPNFCPNCGADMRGETE